jgi:hypothetical protein
MKIKEVTDVSGTGGINAPNEFMPFCNPKKIQTPKMKHFWRTEKVAEPDLPAENLPETKT